MDEIPTLLNEDEVLYVRSGRVLMPNPTFKVSEFLDALAQIVSEQEADWTEDCEGWFSNGLDCEVLRFGNQGWQRGRVRIRLEFFPNKPKLLKEQAPARRAIRGEERPIQEEVYTRREEIYTDYEEEY